MDGRLPPQQPRDAGRLTVVLDLDETLIHSVAVPAGAADLAAALAGGVDSFDVDVRGVRIRVNKRPGLDGFLQWASRNFELVVFTASRPDYANAILDVLEPPGARGEVFRHRLFRNHCTSVPAALPLAVQGGSVLTKDLAVVNRPLDRVVLVDNSFHCFLPQVGNGVPIAPFTDNAWDFALFELSSLLDLCSLQADVRPLLRETFSLEKILHLFGQYVQQHHLHLQHAQSVLPVHELSDPERVQMLEHLHQAAPQPQPAVLF